jgi:hypothetical protein
MATNCGKIAAGVLNDCDNPLIGGAKDRLILFNTEDIVDYDTNTSNSQIIEGINLVASPAAVGYVFEGFKSSIEEERKLAPNKYRSMWDHQIIFRIFSNSPETKQTIEGLKDGTFVAILENNNKGVDGNAAFELYGKGVGLYVLDAVATKNDADSQGAYVITLKTPEDQKEPNLPATVFLTSYSVTKTLVDSLV